MVLRSELTVYLANGALSGLPGPGEAPVDVLRYNVKDRPKLSGTPEKIFSVEHRFIPGPSADLPIRIYRPNKNSSLPALVFFHGGGWVLHTLDTFEQALRSLANKGEFVVIAVAYQKAPEHPFPVPFDDCYATLLWVRDHAAELGIDPDAIGVGGDSAGANLAAGVAIKARDTEDIRLAFQALVYPAVDNQCNTDSYSEFAEGFGLTKRAMQWFWSQYVQRASDGKNSYAVPMRAKSLAGTAPAIILTAENDVLLDDGYNYADRLRRDGVKVLYREYEGLIHGTFVLAGVTPASEEMQAYLAQEINALLNEQ